MRIFSTNVLNAEMVEKPMPKSKLPADILVTCWYENYPLFFRLLF